MKILIDTNILIDLFAKREPYFESAKVIIFSLQEPKINGCIAAHSILNIFYILRKSFSIEERRRFLMNLCKFLDVIGIDPEKINTSLSNDNFSDLEDCLQAECAKDFGADYIITRNIRTCLHKLRRTSFRQILPLTALKILAIRQYACGFLPCHQQNYARKSAHQSCEDRF